MNDHREKGGGELEGRVRGMEEREYTLTDIVDLCTAKSHTTRIQRAITKYSK